MRYIQQFYFCLISNIAISYSYAMRNRNQERIAQRIRDLRGDKTQNEVAEVLHITQSYLSELERGKKVPSKALLLDIAKIFNTTVSYLLGETNSVVLPEGSDDARNVIQKKNDALAESAKDCIDVPMLMFDEVFEACRSDLFTKKSDRLVGVPKSDIGQHFSAANALFALKLAGGSNKTFGFPDGCRAVVNPEEPVKNFDIVLVFYNGELALKKILNKDEDEWELLSYDGSKVRMSADEVISGDFKMLGKLTSVTLTPNHGF